jgi:hypothetical protein
VGQQHNYQAALSPQPIQRGEKVTPPFVGNTPKRFQARLRERAIRIASPTRVAPLPEVEEIMKVSVLAPHKCRRLVRWITSPQLQGSMTL